MIVEQINSNIQRVRFTNPKEKDLARRTAELEQENLAKSRLLNETVVKKKGLFQNISSLCRIKCISNFEFPHIVVRPHRVLGVKN